MLLVIDVGNTNITLGIFDGEKVSGTFRMKSKQPRTSDEYGIMLRELVERHGVAGKDIQDVIIASVVPDVMHSLGSAIIKYFGIKPMVVSAGIKTGIRIVTENPRQVGADRIVDAVAAYTLFGGPVIVVDFGTATTVDAIDAQGRYLGGTIGTGLRLSMDALIEGTAMLPRVELCMPSKVIGTSTLEQLQAGVVAGYVGNMEYLISRMKQEMGLEGVKVIATGGLSRLVSENTTLVDVVDGCLTLEGLRLIYNRMKGSA